MLTVKYCMRIQLKKERFVATTSAPASSYEQLGIRIQKIINAPTAQKARAALIFRLEHESPEDWATLLEEIAENDNVTLAYRDDGGVQIFWVVPKED
ncbi:hypothetical protein PspR32_16600 [Pseudomonas sp. R32]|nr:hypothetical protein PspR32_16600 [Pseudomonas sp. R32]